MSVREGEQGLHLTGPLSLDTNSTTIFDNRAIFDNHSCSSMGFKALRNNGRNKCFSSEQVKSQHQQGEW